MKEFVEKPLARLEESISFEDEALSEDDGEDMHAESDEEGEKEGRTENGETENCKEVATEKSVKVAETKEAEVIVID